MLGFDFIFVFVFGFVMVCFVFVIVNGIAEWNRNNHSPRLTIHAVVISKRTKVTHNHHAAMGDSTGAHGYHSTASTFYYITFQSDSGDRMELRVKSGDYGMIAQGDEGSLTFQGTRFLNFQRKLI